MGNLPIYISIVFILTTVLAFLFFWKAAQYSKWVLGISLGWLSLQAGLAASGFYTVTDVLPPRLALAILPPIVAMVILFATQRGRAWIDSLDLGMLTLLHIVRIPVELVLFWLATHLVVPELITFEGRNFDIFSGITAPLIWYFGCIKGKLGRWVMLAWNIVCLALVMNVVIHAILAVPTPFQQLAFEHPNIAVLYFPFIWLPAFVVPVVWFSHFVGIRRWRK